MKLKEKAVVVTALAYPEEDTADWFKKYQRHRDTAKQRGLSPELTFEQYMLKAKEADLKNPCQIGPNKEKFVLGRLGDVGDYSDQNCRFITATQNHREAVENGRYDNHSHNQSVRLTGLTKENSEWMRKASETKRGRTKETHEAHARQSEKISKSFILRAPDGTEYRGSNLSDFCKENGLTVFGMYNVIAGRRNHHKGWTGRYEE